MKTQNDKFEKTRFFSQKQLFKRPLQNNDNSVPGFLRGIIWFAVIYSIFAGSMVMGEDLVIDLFQYGTPTEAQATWVKSLAALPCEPVVEEGLSCLKLPTNIGPTNIGARWDRAVNLDLSAYDRIVLRLKSTRIFTQVGIYFYTPDGGNYPNVTEGHYEAYQHASEKWHTYTFPISSFTGIGDVAGWNNITMVRIAGWFEKNDPTQENDLTPPDLFVSNLRASNNNNINFIKNSAFEVATSEAMPDYWGPCSYSWGTGLEQWVLNTDSWRGYWGVDSTVNHTPGGTNSLRIETISSPVTPELQAVANWIYLNVNEDYTFSVWLRSDTPSLPAFLHVTGFDSATETTVAIATSSITTSPTANTWQRYTLSVTPTLSFSNITCSVYATTPGVLWVDDVQMEPGTTATTWKASLLDAEIPTQTVHKSVPGILDCAITPGGESVTVNIDSNGHFLVDSEPFMPVAAGWQGVPSNDVLQHLVKAGFNTIAPHVYNDTGLQVFLDNAKANGLKVIIWINKDVDKDTVFEDLINDFKNHPAIIAWYVYDEPDGSKEWAEAEAKYDLAKANDPSRPAMVNSLAKIAFDTDWFSDILCTDYYPVAYQDNSIGKYSNIIRTLALTAANATSKKPAWNLIQSGGYSFYCYREPTGAEAECMAYLSLIHGSRGLIYFFQKPRSLEQWREMRILNYEIAQLKPILYSLDTAPTVSANQPSIRTLCKRYNGKNYVIAVNQSSQPVTAELTLSEETTASGNVLFENRSLNVVDGKINDTFAAYHRHIYCIDSFKLHLPFDEDAGASIAPDYSGNDNDGTLANMEPQNDWVPGILGNALDFDGINDYVDCGNSPSLQLTGDLTLAFWVNPNNIGTKVLNPIDKSYMGEFALTVWQHGGLTYYHHSNVSPGYWPAYSTLNLQNNVWQHVAITRDTASREIKFYYDGVLVDTIAYPAEAVPTASSNSLKIGKGYFGAIGGKMDEVRIYDRVLDQSEVGELANNLKLHLTFNEGGGASVAPDHSGNDNDGTLVNMDPQSDWVTGIIGNALDFDGVNDYVSCSNSPSLQLTEDLTIAFWVNPNNIGTKILNPIDKSYTGEFALTVWQHGGLTYYHHSNVSPGYWPAYSNLTIQNDLWQHVAITRNTTDRTIKFYYNGMLVQTIAYPVEAVPSASTSPIKIGKGYFGEFGGQMDDVRIYNRELTPEEVGELANH